MFIFVYVYYKMYIITFTCIHNRCMFVINKHDYICINMMYFLLGTFCWEEENTRYNKMMSNGANMAGLPYSTVLVGSLA